MDTNEKCKNDLRPIQRGDLVVYRPDPGDELQDKGTFGIVKEKNDVFAIVYLADGKSIHVPLHTLWQLPFQDCVTSPANFSELLRVIYLEGINNMLDHSRYFEELKIMILAREKEKAANAPG